MALPAFQEIRNSQQPQTLNTEDLEHDEFKGLTEREELELHKIVDKYYSAIRNADKCIEQLFEKLQYLDGENISKVLASEQQVTLLMNHIEETIKEANEVEYRQALYDGTLLQIRDSMESMGEKNATIELINENCLNLQEELFKMLTTIDIPSDLQIILNNSDITKSSDLERLNEASRRLRNALNTKIDKSLQRMRSVQEQQQKLEKWKQKFSQTIARHLNNLIIHLVNENEKCSARNNEIELKPHDHLHNELLPYSELMCWIKEMDKNAYEGLLKVSILIKLFRTKNLQFYFCKFLSFLFQNNRI